jgi:hypothetical protein
MMTRMNAGMTFRGTRLQTRMRAAKAVLLVLAGLATLAGCGGGSSDASCLDSGGGTAGPRIVIDRGHLGQQPWQLVAWIQGGHLGLALYFASQKKMDSGAVGFCGGPGAGFWMDGPGPDGSNVDYGPTPTAATHAVLTARGHAPVSVPTRPIPHEDGLPRGRFFIAGPPGKASVYWNVTLKDAAGHTVPFAEF